MNRASTSFALLRVGLTLVLGACVADPAATTATNGTSRQVKPGPETDAAASAANNGHITYAVIGDFPYGPVKRAELPALIDKINADPTIERVIHLGDIKAGSSSDCSDAYFADIRQQFDRFDDPLVYTPGDNEWTDCHVASKNNGLYTPTERLVAVRNLFFPIVGRTLGVRSAEVTSQADVDPANAQYVENVMWTHCDVVFASINITGSNNDKAAWGTPLPANASSFPSQAGEQSTRAQATRDWIARAFARGKEAKAVVLMFQADMWDGTLANRATTIDGYDDIVTQIGTLAAQFGKPVLLLEGDSHVFRIDQPYDPSSPLFVLHPNTPVAPNVTRLVVNGSSSRTEYVRLTINLEGRDGNVFTFVEVPLT
jgi:hypothetical protein